MTEPTTSSSLRDLIGFIDLAREKGYLKVPTAAAVKSAVSRVLGVLDERERVDVLCVDLDGVLRRFANLNPGVTSQSLRDYRGRIEKALGMFTEWRADPVNWQPERATRANRGPAKNGGSSRKGRRLAGSIKPPRTSPGDVHHSGVPTGLAYPYPLRADLIVQISNVPRDLKIVEAERLAAFLRSLAEDYKP